jgi:AcrR family transcriptional regulator
MRVGQKTSAHACFLARVILVPREALEPRQDRSRATRERLLEGAVASLSETGWTRTTVASVAERAGVSRGAAQHHFPTRDDLFTAAVEHIATARMTEMTKALGGLPAGPARVRQALDLLVGLYTGPLFRGALQVWTEASVDANLRARVIPLEQRIARQAFALAVSLLEVDGHDPRVRAIIAATLDLGRGLGLADVLTDDADRRSWILDAWAAELARIIAGRPSTPVSPVTD